jgi:hypothetical protein
MEQANNQTMEQQQQHLVVQTDRSPDNNDSIDLHISQDDYLSIEANRFAELNHQQQQHQHNQDQQSQLQHQSPPQHQDVHQQQQTHQFATPQSQLQTLPSSTSAFAPVHPVRPTPYYPPSTSTAFSDNMGQQNQTRNFRPLTPPLPAALPQPYQQLGPSHIPALFVKIHLITKDEATNITQSTLMAQKFYPATFLERHLSNSFYTTLKESYMADLRQTVPFKQMSQIGVRHELRSMTCTYTSNNNFQHTLNLTNPLTPEEKMIAPNPRINTNSDYGQFVELNISFDLRLHKPPPEAYTLTLDDRNMMRSFLDHHKSRNPNPRNPNPRNLSSRTNSPIQHRVGYQTQNFRNRDSATARTAPREYPRGDPRDMARRDQELRRRTPQGAPSLQEQQQNLTYHDNGSISFEQDGVTYETTFHGRNYYNLP